MKLLRDNVQSWVNCTNMHKYQKIVQKVGITMGDRRTKKTKKSIKDALLSLLQKKKLTKITVSEICQVADIGRGTFYLHYQDIFDLHEQLENELLEYLLKWVEALYERVEPITFTMFMENVAEFMVQNQAAFKIFMNQGKNNTLILKIKEMITAKEFEDRTFTNDIHHFEFEKYKISFQIAGTIEVLNQWIKDGMTQSPKEISTLISNMINNEY